MSSGTGPGDWADHDVDPEAFGDKRLASRLRMLLGQMSGAIGDPIPAACQDWANTKAAYRFFSNDTVSEGEILAGHFQATAGRVAAVDGPVLVLQDTTEFSYRRKSPEKIGSTTVVPGRREANGRFRMHTVCGLLMHASLVVTTEGLPLGLSAIKFWSRAKFKGTNALKRQVNPTRITIEEKESIRWLENMNQSCACLGRPDRLVQIGDRENDIYEFFCAARAAGTHFLVRSCVDRLADDGKHTIADKMGEVPVKGLHRIAFGSGEGDVAELELRYKRIRVRPPIGKRKRYPDLTLTVLHACERDEPEDRPRIDWKPITDLPVETPEAAIEKLNWYAQRWKLELFHKILKSGCRAEQARLRTADRLVNLIAVSCVVGWREFWLTMINRIAPEGSPQLALTPEEIDTISRLRQARGRKPAESLAEHLLELARLGGYLARAHDPPPGSMVIWRGWRRLSDVLLGSTLSTQTCG
ncbi:MAG: IS4 family transposase [Ponticaulis sp.]|nr:IS4 family transposase [Ponticaulis sp.]